MGKRGLLGLLLTFTLFLSGCSTADAGMGMTKFDATAYVNGLLNQTYKGTWDSAYLTLVDQSEDEANDIYDDSLAQEYRRFCYQFDIMDTYLADGTKERILDLLSDVSAKANYSVRGAVELDDERYTVEVVVSPMNLLIQVRDDEMQAYTRDFEEWYEGADVDDMTPKTREIFWERYETTWADGIVDMCRAKMGTLGYEESMSMMVIVSPDDNGLYGISDNDFANLSTLIMPY